MPRCDVGDERRCLAAVTGRPPMWTTVQCTSVGAQASNDTRDRYSDTSELRAATNTTRERPWLAQPLLRSAEYRRRACTTHHLDG